MKKSKQTKQTKKRTTSRSTGTTRSAKRQLSGSWRDTKFNIWLAVIAIVAIAAVGIVILFPGRAGKSTYSMNPTTKKITGRQFSDDSPINQSIPRDVKYVANSTERINAAGQARVSLLEWSVPVFDVDASAPKEKIWCWLYAASCKDIHSGPQPVPSNVFSQRGSDLHVTIIDHSTRQRYDYWRWKSCAEKGFFPWEKQPPVGTKWCPGSGDAVSIDGTGIGGGTNVADFVGGQIRTYEIEQGYIDHALTFSTSTTCKDTLIYPARNTDGVSTDQSTCMPAGTRIQLDPTVNVDSLPNITAMEKMMAKALQKYGAYMNDSGGSFVFGVEFDQTGRQVYQKAGAAPNQDNFSLKGIPWDKVKVLEPQWNADGTKAYVWGSGAGSSTPTTTTIPTTTTAPPTTTPTTTSAPPATPIPTPATSPVISGSTLDKEKPSTPTGLKSSVAYDSLRLAYYTDLRWTASRDNIKVANYEVKRNKVSLGTSTTPAFRDYKLSSNTYYTYEVFARDAAGNISIPASTSLIGKCFLVWCWKE